MSAAGSAFQVPGYECTIGFHTDRTFPMRRFNVEQGCPYFLEIMINVKKQSRLPVVTLFSTKQSRFPDVSGGDASGSRAA
ncbi:hypothetical protein HCN83_05055 [Bacillus luteus]|uniref:Uncharacterized protein n=1 Tax=Alkalicoccus luteus TaxID=1237094 RepID=A0A969TUD5_9BACI|nr:hypothetical protein [Alkalicoccus luteus]